MGASRAVFPIQKKNNYKKKDICKHTKKSDSVEIYVALQNMTEEMTGNSDKKKGLAV